MQEKFTPGPWQADGESVESVDGTYVADCAILFATIDRTVENEANAQLIAAAPDLLEGLREARDCIHSLMMIVAKMEHDELPHSFDGIGVRMSSAIAKAEGSTP